MRRTVAPLARALCAVAVVVTSVGAGVPPAAAAETAPPPGGAFRAVQPVKVLDTRLTQTSPKAAGSTVTARVTGGSSGVPTSGVAAVAVNLTAVAATGSGSLTAYPTGTARPGTPQLRYPATRYASNLVTVPVGSNGTISVYVGTRAAHVVVEVQGWYSTAATTVGTAGLFKPLTPARLLDTRSGYGGVKIPAKGILKLQVSGRRGVPSSGAGAVSLNATVVAPAAAGFLTIYPRGAAQPATKNVSFVAGQTVANRAVVRVGSYGQVLLYNGGSAPLHVLADVGGWFTTASANPAGGGYFNAVPSKRTYDSGSTPIGTTPRGVNVTGVSAVPAANVVAVAMTTTVVAPTAAGYLRVYPAEPAPTSNDQNHVAGQTIASHALAKTSPAGTVQLRNSAGSLRALVDVSGYYLRLPPPAFATTSLVNGAAGIAYDQQLAGTGGQAPYTFTFVSGSLAPGLTLDTAGRYYGTPTTAGSYAMVLRIRDAWGESATKSFTHVIDATAPGPLEVTTAATLPQATVGAAYTKTLAAGGGTPPYAWTVSSGTLPDGLALSAGGVVSGTPTTAQTRAFTVRVTDANAGQATKELTLTVAAPLVVTTPTTLPQGKKDLPYETTLAATGGTPGYTWSITLGTLPTGLTLAPDGTISGTPTSPGTNFTVRVTDAAARTATKALSLPMVAFVFTTETALPGATAGAPYSTTLATANGAPPVTFAVTAGVLPAGLALSQSGTLSGTPAAAGPASFTVQASGSDGITTTKTFTLSVAAAPAPAVTTTSLPSGRAGVPYTATLAATGGTTPYTWAVVAGALPAGLSLSAGGVVSGTPTAAGTSSPTFRVTDANTQTAQATLPLTITAGSDWTQPHYDMGRTGHASDETAITPANAAGLHQVWSLNAASSATAVAGGVLYTGGSLPDEGESALTAYDIRTRDVLWQVRPQCGTGDIAVTSAAVVTPCDGRLRAYSRTGSHALLWDTAVTDPGSGTVYDFAVMSDRVIVLEGTALYAYSLTTGNRLWRQFLPSGAFGSQVAVSGTTAVVAMQDRLRSYNTTTGVAGWTVTGSAHTAIVDNGAVYAALDGELRRLDLATGAQQWASDTGQLVSAVLAGNGSKVLAQWRLDNPDAGIETRTLAFNESNGSLAWEAHTPNRVMHAAMTPSLVWLTTADYAGMFGSDTGTVTAISLADGSPVHTIDTGRRIFAATAVSDGRLVVARSTSLRVYGFDRQLPTVTTKVLRSGFTGRAYSDALTATGGVGPYAWTVASGTLPAGITLSGAGVLSGTPTAAVAPRVVVRVTDSLGATATRSLVVQVGAAAAGSWPTVGGNFARTGLAAGESTVGLDAAPMLNELWSSAAMAAPVNGSIAVVGNVAYLTEWQTGNVHAYSTTGTAAGRTPIWTARTDNPEQDLVQTGVTVSGGRLLVGTLQGLYSFDATTGVKQWKAPYTHNNPGGSAPLVVGTRVFVGDGDGGLHAFDLATGAPAWTEAFVPDTYLGMPPALDGLATDGTRVFATSACHLYALAPATGAVQWKKVLTPSGSPNCAYAYRSVPLVSGGIVYAGSQGGTMAFDTVTGDVVWHRSYGSGGSMALSNGTLLLGSDEGGHWLLRAVDPLTGALLWKSVTLASYPGAVVAGDLVLASTGDGVTGVDIRTGDVAWAGTPAAGSSFMYQPAVVNGVIYHVGHDSKLRAYGVPA